MKKFLVVLVIAFAVVVQFSQVEASDYYVGNEADGDEVYLMTDTIKKTSVGYSEQWRHHYYEIYMTFKAVNPTYGSIFFGYTISYGPEELPGYKDRNGKWQGVDESGDVNPHINSDPDVHRAKILNRAYKYLYDNGYI